MSQAIGTIRSGGYVCVIREDADGRVYFIADADIDADGANGQAGGPAAYRIDDTGTDYLKNAGLGMRRGRVVCVESWARKVVILGTDEEPKVFEGGVIASKTAYRYRGVDGNDPAAYVDSETIPYLVVPPLIIEETTGIVLGCRGRITYKDTAVDCVVADVSPANLIGEMSISAARALGIPHSPRNGGFDDNDLLYELWPGQAAPGFTLQPS